MLTAIVTACGVWGGSAMLGKRLDSGWGVLLPCALMPLIAMKKLTINDYRLRLVVDLLAPDVMLYRVSLRHCLLLQTYLTLTGGLAAFAVHFISLFRMNDI